MKSKNEKANKNQEETSSTEVENIEIISHPVVATQRLTHGGSSDTFFEPNQRDQTPQGSNNSFLQRQKVPAPEKKLTLFALRLVVLEKTATSLGSLGFVWATVVLLGGFAIKLLRKDFWFVTVILISEAARTFSRSHELEWQHQSTWSVASAGRNSFRAIKSSSRFIFLIVTSLCNPVYAVQPVSERNQQIREDATKAQEFQKRIIGYLTQRAWHGPEVPLLPYSGWMFLSKNVSRVLSWLQIVSAIACISLSLIRLIEQDYGENSIEADTQNRGSALNLFYSLALAEAMIFLLEKGYWTWKISHGKLLDHVSQDCDLGADGMAIVKRFFYDAYSQCIAGSIFDGIKMDLVTFAEELLDSAFLEEQLIAVRVLQRFVKSSSFSFEAIRKISTNTRVIERLIEMLNWKSLEEEEMRKAAAEIVSELAGKRHCALRVARIPGAMESISSLLYMGKENASYDYCGMNLYGLLILKRLTVGNNDNCFKIGNTSGLLPRVIDFTGPTRQVLQNEHVSDSQIRAIKRSLKVVRMLVRVTGTTGKILRQEISEIVFAVSNMRNILEYGGRYIKLQRLAIDILTGLAMDETAKERIASTGGVIRLLFSIFFGPGVELEGIKSSVMSEAGEAIAMLALESKRNCCLILKKADIAKLVAALEDPVLQLNALRILRNLCAYSGDECKGQLEKVATAMPFVLRTTMEKKEKVLETSIGLTTQICKLTDRDNFITELQRAKIPDEKYVETLTNILKEYKFPEIKVPRIRRFVVQQAKWMMKHHKQYIELFKRFDMEKLLESVRDSTSDLECFHVFSGSVGLSLHRKHLSALVDDALELLNST